MDSHESNMVKARNYCFGMMKGPEGIEAEREMYYTELFTFIFKQALSNVINSGQPYALMPDKIPQDWLNIGDYRKAVKNGRLVKN